MAGQWDQLGSKSGDRKLPVGPASTAGLQARSCILVEEGAKAEKKKRRKEKVQQGERISGKGTEFETDKKRGSSS